MKYKFLLFDLDGTLLDFNQAERFALTKALQTHHVTPTEQMLDDYKTTNLFFWEQFEKGIFTKEEIKMKRFETFLIQNNLSLDPSTIADLYLRYLKQTSFTYPNAIEVLDRLKKHYQLYVITNGIAEVQFSRLKHSGLHSFFEQVFVSEAIGVPKPHVAFFDYVATQIDSFDRSKALIIGDSLSSDIQGGHNYHVDTVWISKSTELNGLKPTYHISTIIDLLELL